MIIMLKPVSLSVRDRALAISKYQAILYDDTYYVISPIMESEELFKDTKHIFKYRNKIDYNIIKTMRCVKSHKFMISEVPEFAVQSTININSNIARKRIYKTLNIVEYSNRQVYLGLSYLEVKFDKNFDMAYEENDFRVLLKLLFPKNLIDSCEGIYYFFNGWSCNIHAPNNVIKKMMKHMTKLGE